MVFKKSFLFISLILAATLIQPAFAMDDATQEKSSIHKWLTAGYKTLREMADTIDEIQGCDAPPPLPIRPSETPFFKELPDEVAVRMVFQLCQDQQALEGLGSIACTCRKGYQLTQRPELWEPLKRTYFRHLPKEYMEVLVRGKKEQGFPLARTLLQELLAYQLEEMKRLKDILLASNSDGYSLMDSLPVDFKKELCRDLGPQKNSNLKQHPAEIYCYQEKKLSHINTRLIEAYLTLTNPDIVPHMRIYDIFFWREGITRLPLEAIDLIKQCPLLHKDTGINIYLGDNQLRWIPSELFSIKKINRLNFMNNLLCYLPHKMEHVKDHLTCLELGNWEPRFGEASLLNNGSGRRTSGNTFKTIPLVILKLSKLERLNMKSVELEEFSNDKIYEALPKLSYIDVSHNNLPIIPQSTFKGRNIDVISLDNPAYGFITLDRKTWNYRGDMSVVYVARGIAFPFVSLKRIHQYGVNIFGYLCDKMSHNDIND